MPRVLLIHQRLRVLNEGARVPVAAPLFRPVTGMQVLDQEDSAVPYRRPHLLEGGDLLGHGVTTVLDQYIDRADLLAQSAKERPILLVTKDDLDAGAGHARAAGIDVDTNDPGVRAEIVPPHLQRAALINTKLDHGHRPIPVRRKVPMVDVEIVDPLVDQRAGIVAEVFLERILGAIHSRDDSGHAHALA